MNAPLPLAQRYVEFRDDVFGGLEETPLLTWGGAMPELQLQSLWFGGALGTEFTSEDGERVVVRDFGEWNAGAGPDFTACSVLINGAAHAGDIELDPDVRDWERHHHGANPEFNKVVLHVYVDAPAEARAYTRTSEHRQVVQVRLRPDMLEQGFSPGSKVATARLGRCSQPLARMGSTAVQSLIEAAAQHRLERKARRLHQCVAVHGREQAVYKALAETLGYKHNQRPFVLLAQRLPVRRMLAHEPMMREALLFGVSAFLEHAPFDALEDTARAYLRDLWQHWWKCRASYERWFLRGMELNWSLKATRPGNHPQRRLGALATILGQWSKIIAPLKQADAWNRKNWEDVFGHLAHEFWDTHYTLGAQATPKPIALIGATRVNEMLANVVYPLLVPEKPALWTEFKELPALLDNLKVRRAVLRLFGESERAKDFQRKLHHQQGLLQIYEDFCLEDDSACSDCPFPERLAQWG